MSAPAPLPDPPQLPDNVRQLHPRAARFGQWPAVLVALLLVAAFVVVAMGHFRRGAVLFSGAVVLAFFLRALLPTRDAGLLAVRSRPVDLATLAVLGLAVASLTFLVPPPS